MQQTILSSNSGFTARPVMRFQANEGPNPGVSLINSALLVFLPEPNTAAFATSEFITNNVGTQWSLTIYRITNGAVGAITASVAIDVTSNMLWYPLDPAVLPAGLYRFEIRDPSNFVADQFDVSIFDQNATGGSADVQSINDAIRRIAGLLGYRQRVVYSDYYHAQHRSATVELLDATGATLAQYRNTVAISPEGHKLTEVSAALDSNNLGV